MAAWPVGGLLGFALGFFSFLWGDALTDQQQFLVTRMRDKSAYRTGRVLSQGAYSRAEIIPGGRYRSTPCTPPLRMGSVLWPGTWYRSLTHVLEAPPLSARQGCERYRRRGRIEEAVARTKRVGDLAYWWTGSTQAVPWQSYATLIFSAVRLTICQQVADVVGEPLERIAVEMGLRAFYHDSRAGQRGEADHLGLLLAAHATLLGIVKRRRQHHRERQHLAYLIWGEP